MSTYYPDWFGWEELAELCDFCKLPLHVMKDQQLPFCPNCAADRETARRGRALLSMMRDALILEEAKAKNSDHENRIMKINRLMGYGG